MSCLMLRCFATMGFACLLATPVAAEETSSSLTYSPWTKFCLKEICFIGTDGRLDPDCGPVASATLIERSGDSKETLHVTLPSRVSLRHGVRISVCQSQPIERPYIGCFANRCMAEFEAGAELVAQLKQGRTLTVEAVGKDNSPIRLTIPLVDFANAYDGPSQEMHVFEATAKELQARLEERKARCETRQ